MPTPPSRMDPSGEIAVTLQWDDANRWVTSVPREPLLAADRPTVLLAEDHPDVAAAFRRLLSEDFEVVAVVADGEGLIDRTQQLQPAAIVADIGLKGLDGISATIVIRRILPALPIVLITIDDDLRVAALAAGASAFLPKHEAGSLNWILRGLLHMEREVSEGQPARLHLERL